VNRIESEFLPAQSRQRRNPYITYSLLILALMRSRHEWHGEREAFRRISTKNLADVEAVRPEREFEMNNWANRGTSAFINSVRSIIKGRGEERYDHRIAHRIELSASLKAAAFRVDKRSQMAEVTIIDRSYAIARTHPRGGDNAERRDKIPQPRFSARNNASGIAISRNFLRLFSSSALRRFPRISPSSLLSLSLSLSLSLCLRGISRDPASLLCSVLL